MKRDEDGLALSEDEEIAAAVEVVNRLIAERRLALTVRPAGEADERIDIAVGSHADGTPSGTANLFADIAAAVERAARADEIEDRLNAIIACKSLLRAVALSGAAPAYRHIATLLESTIGNTHAEDLTRGQLSALSRVADTLVSPSLGEGDVRAASARLRGAGLEVIPSVSEEKRIEVLKSLGINIDD